MSKRPGARSRSSCDKLQWESLWEALFWAPVPFTHLATPADLIKRGASWRGLSSKKPRASTLTSEQNTAWLVLYTVEHPGSSQLKLEACAWRRWMKDLMSLCYSDLRCDIEFRRVQSGGELEISIIQALGPKEFKKLNSSSCSGKYRIYLHIEDFKKFCRKIYTRSTYSQVLERVRACTPLPQNLNN